MTGFIDDPERGIGQVRREPLDVHAIRIGAPEIRPQLPEMIAKVSV